MKKRALSLLLALMLLIGLLPVTARAGELDNGLAYEVYEDYNGYKYVEITGYYSDATELDIPAEIEGLPVTSIGQDAFSFCDNLTSIDIPDSVTSIGGWAFLSCSNLTSINIPDSVTSIGENAFRFCENLTTINIPDSVISIGEGAFYACHNLTGIHVDKNNPNYSSDDRGVLFDKAKTVLIQAPQTIAGSYVIPYGVMSIGYGAFYNCSLISIDIPDSVTHIGEEAFKYCNSLTRIDIPDSVISIGSYAFADCSILTTINIPDSVISIGEGAFYGCYNLTSINIPDSVTSIGGEAFSYCESLTGIHVDKNNPNYSSDDRGVLFDKAKTVLIQAPAKMTGSYAIPNSVVSINNRAFYHCANLTSIDIPNGITSIGEEAFSYCESLPSLYIPYSVTSIGSWAFSNCTSLTGIYVDSNNPNYSSDDHGVLFNKDKTLLIQVPGLIANSYAIPYGIASIDDSVFAGCHNLTSVSIPDSVTSIGSWAFKGCSSLVSINIPDSVTYIDNAAFDGCSSLTRIHVDENNPNYSNDDRGVLFDKEKTVLILAPKAIADSYAIPYGVTFIDYDAFYGCDKLTSVSIPDSVTSIGSWAFAYCDNLTSVNIPNSVTFIDDWTFASCAMTSIDIPDSIVSIGYCAFAFCHDLVTIDIPASVISIDDSAFIQCSSATKFHVDENNPNYSNDGRGVLFDKEKTHLIQAPGEIVGSYAIPYGVTSISDEAFGGCDKLTSVSIPDSVTTIGNTVFIDCSSLTNVNIPSGVTTIGTALFYGCSSLTSIDIPDSVTLIDISAFINCSSLTTIRFNGNAPDFGDSIFYGVTATAYYPATNPTWTADVMQDYEGDITWIGYNPEGSFYDVQMGSWYEAPVEWAVENGITAGASPTTFNPDGSCLRSQVVTFLHRAAQSPEPTVTNNPFSDVKPSDFFYKPVLWAVEKGITQGTSATTFGSLSSCNRAAVVTFLWRAKGSPAPKSTVNPFCDVNPTDFFYESVLWAVENGITSGVDATHFAPASPCNRAQVVTFLYRAYN